MFSCVSEEYHYKSHMTAGSIIEDCFCAVFRFKELESAVNGYQILEGSHLEDALCMWSQFADEPISEAAMMPLQHELHRCNERGDELKLIHYRLIVHHAAVADQIAQLVNTSTVSKTELQHIGEQVQVDNSNVSAL